MYCYFTLFYGSWLLVGYAGWVKNVVDSTRFDRIDTNRFPCCRFVMPEVDLRDATPCESSRDVTCKSSWIIKCFRRIDSVSVYWPWTEFPENHSEVGMGISWNQTLKTRYYDAKTIFRFCSFQYNDWKHFTLNQQHNDWPITAWVIPELLEN